MYDPLSFRLTPSNLTALSATRATATTPPYSAARKFTVIGASIRPPPPSPPQPLFQKRVSCIFLRTFFLSSNSTR